MAEIIRYVNTASVGGDGTTNATTGPNAAYSSLVAWNTAEATDLVTAQNTHIVYCEGAADVIAQSTDINMSAWVTNSNYYVTITVDSANRSTLGKLDTSKYHLYKVGSSSWGDIIKYVKYTKVIGLQFYIRANSGTNATRQCLVANTTSEVALTAENCIFDCGGTSAAYTGRPWNITAAGPNYFRNNIVIFDSNLFGAQVLSTTQGSGADNTFIYNNTFIDKNKTAYVFNISNSTNSVWKNNIFQGFLDHFTVGTGNITGSDYNLTDLPSISYGTNNTVNTRLNFGDSYLLSTADFQVLSEGIGPSLDANVPTTDILGNSRSGDTTSVGALNTLSLNYLKLDSQSYSKTHISATLIADADLFTVVIDPPPGYAVHNVTDLSQAGSISSIYYGLSVSIGDQFLYKTTTETNNWFVSVASDGILTATPTGVDTVKFWYWNQTAWSSQLTYSLTSSISPLSAEVTPFNVSTFDTNLIVNRKLIAESYTPVQLWSDDFTGAAGILGSEYTQQGDTNVQRDGLGNAYTILGGRAIAWPNTVTFSNNQYAEITLTQISYLTSASSGLVLRVQTNETPGVEKSYIFRTGNQGEAYLFAEYNETSSFTLKITTTIVPKVGDRLKAIALGNTLYFYVNDQLIVTDSDISWPGGVPGIYGFSQQWKSDNFVAGNHGGITFAGTYTNVLANRVLICDSANYYVQTFEAQFPYKKIRYVNTLSTVGGNGKTNSTTGVDRAYATLESALSTEQANLIAQNVKLEIYCAGGADTSYAGQSSWPSLVTGPNNDVKIYAAPGNTAEESFNSNKYHLIRSTGGQEVLFITSSDNVYMSFYNLQIKSTLTTHTALRISATTSGVTTGKVIVSGCYIEGGTTAFGISFACRNQPHVVVNSILVANGGTSSNTITSVYYNNTVISYSTGSAASAWAGSTIPYYMRNNIFQNYGGGVALSGTLPTNTSSNITNDATSPEAFLRNITLTFKNKIGKNFRLVSDDYLSVGFGTDLSSDPIYPITVDLLGDTRTSWDIGAVKYAPLLLAVNRSHSFTFEQPSLIVNRKLTITESSFSVVYQEVSVTKSSAKKIEAITQTYSIISSEASLLRGLAIPVTAQAFTLTGPPVATLANRVITGEGFRGNYLRNSMMLGAVAGTPGTAPTSWATSQSAVWATRTIIGTGVDSTTGLTYIDVAYSGTNNTGSISSLIFDPISATTQLANNGETWTSSAYFGLVSGSWPSNANIISVFRNSSSVGVGNSSVSIKSISSSTLQRFTSTFTANNVATKYVQTAIRFDASNGETVNFTVRIAAPQLERGSVAKAFIPTTNGIQYRWFETTVFATNLLKNSFLSANTGNFELSSFPISTPRTYGLLCSHATFAITSEPVGILKQSKLAAESRNFDLAEQTAALKTSRKLGVQSTSLSVVSQEISLERSFRLFATSQSYTLVRPATTLTFVRKIQATSRTFTLSPFTIAFDRSYVLVATSSAKTITFPVTGVYASRRIYLTTQTYFVPIRVWDGGAWTPKPLKIWTGTEWQIIL